MEAAETWLVDEVRKVIEKFPEYGTRRITAVLRRRHQKYINHKKIHSIVKEHCWQLWKRPYGNHPRVQGKKKVTPQPNSHWAIDIRHLLTKQDGWCQLASVIDCSDRYLVGWRFSRSGKAAISTRALEDALIRENIIPKTHGFVIRSNNGLVFGSKQFHETVTKY